MGSYMDKMQGRYAQQEGQISALNYEIECLKNQVNDVLEEKGEEIDSLNVEVERLKEKADIMDKGEDRKPIERYELREGDDILVRMTVYEIQHNCMVIVGLRGQARGVLLAVHRNEVVSSMDCQAQAKDN